MIEGAAASEADRRFMAAAIRLSTKNVGRTATNPSVGTLIVARDDDGLPVIVGRGVTAIGGRPHAETEALAEAGERARGATAYVTLEPCAHHGRTPPCAEALISAGIARVVGGASDPDWRVSGRGYAMLREAGVDVVEGVHADQAREIMSAYLTRSLKKRAEVTLKLAISADGMIGRVGAGQVAITGPEARRQTHMLRSRSDAILVGIGTAIADNPSLTTRLPGLEQRSPIRIVLDPAIRLPKSSHLAVTARLTPLLVAAPQNADRERRSELEAAGVRFIAAEVVEGRIALPELLEDLAGQGISSVLVEGGAATAKAFLDEGMVDRLVLIRGTTIAGEGGIRGPVAFDAVPSEFALVRSEKYGEDECREWIRT